MSCRLFINFAILITAAASLARAEVYAFNVTSGDWNVSTNWDPNGVPGVNDKAVIGNLTTCTIGSADQSAKELVVAGTLVVDGRKLTTTAAGGSASVISDGKIHLKGTSPQWEIAVPLTLNGTLHFDGTDPELLISSSITITGSGNLEGRKWVATDSEYGGGLISLPGSNIELILDTYVTAIGSLTFANSTSTVYPKLRNDGTIKVNSTVDYLQLRGIPDTGLDIYGNGQIVVSDGTLDLWKVRHWGGQANPPTSLKWNVSGGAVVVDIYTTFYGSHDSFEISGGELRILERPLCTHGTIDWTGGKITTPGGEPGSRCAKFGVPETDDCGTVAIPPNGPMGPSCP